MISIAALTLAVATSISSAWQRDDEKQGKKIEALESANIKFDERLDNLSIDFAEHKGQAK